MPRSLTRRAGLDSSSTTSAQASRTTPTSPTCARCCTACTPSSGCTPPRKTRATCRWATPGRPRPAVRSWPPSGGTWRKLRPVFPVMTGGELAQVISWQIGGAVGNDAAVRQGADRGGAPSLLQGCTLAQDGARAEFGQDGAPGLHLDPAIEHQHDVVRRGHGVVMAVPGCTGQGRGPVPGLEVDQGRLAGQPAARIIDPVPGEG